MPWSTPSFEEIKMDAEARGYGGWVDDEKPAEEETASEQGASAGPE